MTFTDTTTTRFELVTFDLYKDIHKGIRAELFALTESAGRTDPADDVAVAALADHVRSTYELLESHAEHEDVVMQPAVESVLPDVAERIAVDHLAFERRGSLLVELAGSVVAAPAGDRRRLVHLLYLDTASFVSTYLDHQDVEERVVMPALEAALGVDAMVAMHGAIVGSIPPPEMAKSLALMLPAMNVDDRTDMLAGMRATAPAEVFEGVWSLAGSVLDPRDLAAVARRLAV
jgi:hypothetical protein